MVTAMKALRQFSSVYPAEPMVITTAEAAKLLRVTPQTVVRMMRTGVLEGFKVNRFYRVSVESITAYMNAGLEADDRRGRTAATG